MISTLAPKPSIGDPPILRRDGPSTNGMLANIFADQSTSESKSLEKRKCKEALIDIVPKSYFMRHIRSDHFNLSVIYTES